MKFIVMWEHKTGFPSVPVFKINAKTPEAAEKVADDVIPKSERKFCKVHKKGKRGKP